MNRNQAEEKLNTVERELTALWHAMGTLSTDGETAAPKESWRGRGRTMETLAGMEHRLLTDPAFGEALVFNGAAHYWYCTLGQFSLVRLERDSQLVIPVYNYSLPENECVGSSDDDPCTLFGRIRFPVEEFYPPDRLDQNESYRALVQ